MSVTRGLLLLVLVVALTSKTALAVLHATNQPAPETSPRQAA